jgi:sugar/nucleoside kinase (ribokinase family)
MAKIVTLGEIMLRLSPQGNDRFIQSESFRIIPGGGEANVAISVANYGHEAYFVSKLPKHEIGQIAVNALRRYGVNTEFIARGGDRVGLYYPTMEEVLADPEKTRAVQRYTGRTEITPFDVALKYGQASRMRCPDYRY